MSPSLFVALSTRQFHSCQKLTNVHAFEQRTKFEPGKAGAEPASGGSQRIQPARAPAANGGSPPSSQNSYGSRPTAPQSQQQQYNSNSLDDTAFDSPQQEPVYASTKSERPAAAAAAAPPVSQTPLFVTSAPNLQRVYQESSPSPSTTSQPLARNYQQQQQENFPTKVSLVLSL